MVECEKMDDILVIGWYVECETIDKKRSDIGWYNVTRRLRGGQ